MAKKLIRLTEGDLHRIVKESVKRVLNEASPKNKWGRSWEKPSENMASFRERYRIEREVEDNLESYFERIMNKISVSAKISPNDNKLHIVVKPIDKRIRLDGRFINKVNGILSGLGYSNCGERPLGQFGNFSGLVLDYEEKGKFEPFEPWGGKSKPSKMNTQQQSTVPSQPTTSKPGDAYTKGIYDDTVGDDLRASRGVPPNDLIHDDGDGAALRFARSRFGRRY